MAGARLKPLARWLVDLLTDSGSTSISMSNWRAYAKECDIQRLSISFWSSVGYVGLGAALVIFGPTVLDLGQQLGVGVGILSIMLVCRAVGSAVGSVGAGVALDKLHNFSYAIMSGVLLFSSATTVVVPLSVNIYMLAVFMFLNGLATGALDSGTHAVLMKLWKEKSGPCMQVLHFAFALGAFLAPVIAKGFISEDLQDDGNSTSCVGSSQDLNYSRNLTTSEEDNGSRFRIAYWISSSLFVPTFVAYGYYAVKFNVIERLWKRKETATNTSDDTDTKPLNADDHSEIEPDDDVTGVSQSLMSKEGEDSALVDDEESSTSVRASAATNHQLKLFKVMILALLSSFMFVYVGLEVAYGSWIFTVVVKGALNFCKVEGTKIQSLFWGTFAFTRLISVVLALLRVKASVMMAGNLFGSTVAAVIMVSAPHSIPAIWLASAVLGMSYASIYPTTMTWMSETIEATGTATAVLVTGGILGDISIPAVMGVLIEKITPDSLFYFTFVGIIVSASFVSLMFLVAYLQKRKQMKSQFHELNNGLVEKDNEERKDIKNSVLDEISQNSHL